MKVVLSFDDGRIDTYTNAFPIIKENGLTASVHITSGFIDETFKTDEFGIGMKPIPTNSLLEMYDYGIDISSHGDRHKMEAKDYFMSKEKISRWLGKNERLGFSVPNSAASKESVQKFLDETNEDPLYIRVGRNAICKRTINKIRYIIYKIFHTQTAYDRFNKNNLIISLDKYFIVSSVVKKHTRAVNITKFIRKHINENCIFVLMFHTITDNPKNGWEWNKNEFALLCSHLNAMKDNDGFEVLNLKELTNEK